MKRLPRAQRVDTGYGMYSYEGIATFAGCPYAVDVVALEQAQPDVAIIGAPFDISTTHRPGARFGPRALRTQAYHPGVHFDAHADTAGIIDGITPRTERRCGA